MGVSASEEVPIKPVPAGFHNPQVVYYVAPTRSQSIPPAYKRDSNQSYDDMFDGGCFNVCVNKGKGLQYHEPTNAPRSNLDSCKHVDWSLQKMNTDNSKAVQFRPKMDMLRRNRQDHNVTHMSRYAGTGEAFDGANKTDSVSKHVKHGREFALRM